MDDWQRDVLAKAEQAAYALPATTGNMASLGDAIHHVASHSEEQWLEHLRTCNRDLCSRWAAETKGEVNYTGSAESVECAYPPCRNRLRRAGTEERQWCSQEHREASYLSPDERLKGPEKGGRQP